MVQSFVVRGWLDNQEWGDEPPDPDDVWTEGDSEALPPPAVRVRLKDSTAEGTVQASESQPFLGGYLPYVQVLWDGKALSVPVEPDLLVRLSRTLPEQLTWQAAESFSDCKEVLSVRVVQGEIMKTKTMETVSSEQLPVTSEEKSDNCSLVTDNCKFKPGDTVYVKRGKKRIKRVVGDSVGTGDNYGKILTLGGRSGKQEYWELPFNLELCSLTVETALLDFEELLGALDEQTFTSIVTLGVHFYRRYDEQQILTVLDQLEKQGRVAKQLCPDGKTYSWRKTISAQVDSETLTKIYNVLPAGDGWIGDWGIVKELGYEFALIQVQKVLKQLESEGKATKSTLNSGVVWQKGSQSTTSAVELDSATQPLPQSSENPLTSSDSVKSTTTADESSASDIPVFELNETSELEKRLRELEQGLLVDRSPVNPSASPENATGQLMSETFSPTSSTSLTTSDQTTLPSKTSLESSSAPMSLGEPPEDFLSGFSGSFTSGGIMFSGKLLEAPTLALPSLEKGLFWLRSPQALSSTSEVSRPPGQTKLEIQLKELGLIGQNQVINPEFLARALYNLPANWASVSELRAATEILETSEKPMETALTQELPTQPLTTLPELNNQDLQEHPSSIETDRGSSRFGKEPLSVRLVHPQQSIESGRQIFIQNDASSFEWQGSGEYWIYPESVVMDMGTQSRVQTDEETVKYYCLQMKDDLWEWEASIVGLVWDGEQLLPYDGHHRLEAACAAKKMLLARITEGDLQKAIALSCGSNKKPSLRRTKEDNQKTLQMLENLRKEHGDPWLLDIINADLPQAKSPFKEVSLRAIEAYTGIPFTTISGFRSREKKPKQEKLPKVSFVPTDEEMKLIQSIMDAEGLEKPSQVIHWLLEEYKKS